MFWLAITMTIVANVTYNICTKTTARVHPLAALAVTYFVAFATCMILYPLTSKSPQFFQEMKKVNGASFVLGLAIVLLETGFIMAFRSGWSLSSATLFSNVAVTIILIPISFVFFRGQISWQNGVGMLLAVGGLLLMAKK